MAVLDRYSLGAGQIGGMAVIATTGASAVAGTFTYRLDGTLSLLVIECSATSSINQRFAFNPTTSLAIRKWFLTPTLASGQTQRTFASVRTSAGVVGRIWASYATGTTNTLQFAPAAGGANIDLGTVTAGAWYELSLRTVIDTSSTGEVHARLFDATATQVGADVDVTNANLGTTPLAAVDLGILGSFAESPTFRFSRLQIIDGTTYLPAWPDPTVSTQAVGMVPSAELRMSDLDVPPFDDLTLTEFFGETPATPAGGSAATSTATAPGAGQKATTGSAAATTSATTPSAGHKASQGAATANTAATATAGGIKRPTSGTAATSTTTSTGAGSKLGQGAAHAAATATTTGGGARVSAGAGGSAATATATSVGAGHKLTSSGGSATATAATTTAGHKQGVGASGATSTGTTSGAGYTRRSGGTGTTATAAGLGGGRKLTPGGQAAITAGSGAGSGVRLTWGGSYAGATASATGGGASTAGWADITITGSIPPRTHTGGAMASRHSGGVGITRHAATIGGTTKTGTIDAPRWAGRIEP